MLYPFWNKCQFWILCKSMFILRRKPFFLTRTSSNTFSGCILHKTKRWQNFKFLTKPMDPSTFWKNCQFCGFLKPVFSLFRNACFLYKMSKIVFSRFIFTIYDMGIQGDTRKAFFLTRTSPNTFSGCILHKTKR